MQTERKKKKDQVIIFPHYHHHPCCSLRCDSVNVTMWKYKANEEAARQLTECSAAQSSQTPSHFHARCLGCCLVWPFLIHHSSRGVIAKVLQVSESTPHACLSAHYLWLIGQHVWSTCAQTVPATLRESVRSRRCSWSEASRSCDLYLFVSLECWHIRLIIVILLPYVWVNCCWFSVI